MIVDTSALVAVLAREAAHDIVFDALDRSEKTSISTASMLELRIVLLSKRFSRVRGLVDDTLRQFRIEQLDFTSIHAELAAEAHSKYGKGRHPAGLNFGDCMSYATAKLAGEPLLFVGDDFAQTDIESALPLT